MSWIIVKVRDKYLVQSTVVDAPITFGMTLDELLDFYMEEMGRSCVESPSFHQSLRRLASYGTTCLLYKSAEETLEGNHAGPNGEELTFEEIYKAYVLREPIRGGWLAE